MCFFTIIESFATLVYCRKYAFPIDTTTLDHPLAVSSKDQPLFQVTVDLNRPTQSFSRCGIYHWQDALLDVDL